MKVFEKKLHLSALASAIAMSLSFPLNAETFVVSTTDSTNLPGSLKKAFESANRWGGENTIVFNSSLSGLTINVSNETDGRPALYSPNDLTLDASSLSEPVTIEFTSLNAYSGAGIASSESSLTINNVNFVDEGLTSGGIFSLQQSSLSLNNVELSSSNNGGSSAIHAENSDITLISSTITGMDKGVIHAVNEDRVARIDIHDTVITNNKQAVISGDSYYGGVSSYIDIVDSTITGNESIISGGSYYYGVTSHVSISGSEISNNKGEIIKLNAGEGGEGYGGSFYVDLQDSVISSNTGEIILSEGNTYVLNVDIENSYITENQNDVIEGFSDNYVTSYLSVNLGNSYIDGNNGSFLQSFTDYLASVTIENSTITGNSGYAIDHVSLGGSSYISITDSEISKNEKAAYLTLFGEDASLVTIENSSIVENNDSGLSLVSLGSQVDIEIRESKISKNVSNGDGAGLEIYAQSAGYYFYDGVSSIFFPGPASDVSVSISDTTIADNHAGESGGAISLLSTGTEHEADTGASIDLNIESSTFSGNHANDEGGAISAQVLSALGNINISAVNSTMVGNQSEKAGGAIYAFFEYEPLSLHERFSLDLTNSTVSNNISGKDSAAIHIASSDVEEASLGTESSSISISNSVIANSYQAFLGQDNTLVYEAANDILASDGIFQQDQIANLVEHLPASLSTYFDFSITGVDPLLDTSFDEQDGSMHVNLVDTGASTLVLLPLAGSPLIDAGNNALAKDANGGALGKDQLASERISNGIVDIGAVETLALEDANDDIDDSDRDVAIEDIEESNENSIVSGSEEAIASANYGSWGGFSVLMLPFLVWRKRRFTMKHNKGI